MTTKRIILTSEQVKVVSEILSNRMEDVFEALDIRLKDNGNYYAGACPVHLGDNTTALNIYKDGFSNKGYWTCYTHHCEKHFKQTIIGFIRGVLSANKDWNTTNVMVSWNDTLVWIEEFLGQPLKDVQVDYSVIEQSRFCNSVRVVSNTVKNSSGISKDSIRKMLKFPCEFLINRGFDEKILDEYSVGISTNVKSRHYNRIVVPVYDNTGKSMVSFTSRSLSKECGKCKLHHENNLPCSTGLPKWFNDEKTSINNFLYNNWSAKESILKTKKAILVEGPLDVIKLVQLGFKNVLGIFGTSLTEQQEILLEMSGAFDIVLLLDNDEPGRIGCNVIKEKIKNTYRKIIIPQYPNGLKDPGELNSESCSFVREKGFG